MAEVALIQVSFPNVAFEQKKNDKNENTEYHGMSIPLKIQVYSKRGSPTFISLVWVMELLVKVKFFLKTVTCQT